MRFDMSDPKPYTLEWWLDILLECFFRQESIYIDRIEKGKKLGIMVDEDALAKEYQRLSYMVDWITHRIIIKYGED